MKRLTKRTELGVSIDKNEDCPSCNICWNCNISPRECKYISDALKKLADYEDLEEQGRLIKLPVKDGATVHRECVHIKSTCYHENYKCSECPLTELFCNEFYKAIDRCYEEAYASGCFAGIELGKSEAKLKELRGNQNGKV